MWQTLRLGQGDEGLEEWSRGRFQCLIGIVTNNNKGRLSVSFKARDNYLTNMSISGIPKAGVETNFTGFPMTESNLRIKK